MCPLHGKLMYLRKKLKIMFVEHITESISKAAYSKKVIGAKHSSQKFKC